MSRVSLRSTSSLAELLLFVTRVSVADMHSSEAASVQERPCEHDEVDNAVELKNKPTRRRQD